MITAKIIAALILVESSGNPRAHNPATDAAGILQIRKIMVDDANRIARKKIFSYEDRWDPARSRAMCYLVLDHYCTPERLGREPTLEDYALTWFAGPTRARKLRSTRQCQNYIVRVRQALA